jgi:spore germination cell wall hydrolase CwlJ-like protein
MNSDQKILRKINNRKEIRDIQRLLCLIILVGIALIAILVIDMRCRSEARPLPDTEKVQMIVEDVEQATTLTTEERDLIERVVAAESRGEILEGQMAVAQVIKNRSELWGKSITEVVLAEAQFADPYQGEVSDLTKEAVSRVFDKGEIILKEPVTHFFSGEKPYWADNKLSIIGNHFFCM